MAAEDNGLPTRDKCNLDDPEEMFLWALIGMNDVRGAQVMVSFEHLRAISKQIYQVGGRLTSGAQIKYRPPVAPPMSPFGDQGSWVPIDEPDPVVDPLVAQVNAIRPEVLKRAVEISREQHPEMWD